MPAFLSLVLATVVFAATPHTQTIHGLALEPEPPTGARVPLVWWADLAAIEPALRPDVVAAMRQVTLRCAQAPNAALGKPARPEVRVVEDDGRARLRVRLAAADVAECRYGGLSLYKVAFSGTELERATVITGRWNASYQDRPCTLDEDEWAGVFPIAPGAFCDDIRVDVPSVQRALVVVRKDPGFACNASDAGFQCTWTRKIGLGGISEADWPRLCRTLRWLPADSEAVCMVYMR